MAKMKLPQSLALSLSISLILFIYIYLGLAFVNLVWALLIIECETTGAICCPAAGYETHAVSVRYAKIYIQIPTIYPAFVFVCAS